uniref:Acyl-coenzyme A oxidase n=1 Tax=Mycena chlorophos TaxID=658473 RepID=A0ABQ0LCD3_MYCCL|nr:peroxisomal oxidase [Mycena chlorophos]
MAPHAHDAAKQNAIDMANARAATTINVAAVRDFLHDGSETWQRHERIVKILEKEPLFDKSQRLWTSRTDQYILGQAKTKRLLVDLKQKHNWSEKDLAVAFAVQDDPLPITLHNVAFEPIFRLQASPELLATYGDLTAHKAIHGAYLQTELGHGTNVGRLETTATYLPDTREFEIHSPTLTSTKWWIGALGKTATHGVVQAKLILPSGKDMGPHLFFVQLRDLNTHKVLPGLTLGDIGPKAMGAFAATDNGFARFDHVRIPKGNMLSRSAGVTDAGEYITPPHAKLSYGGMLYIRSGMTTSAGWAIGKAATIAIRYTTVRRQGEIGSDGLERQVLSYPSLNVRLVPMVARAYVFIELGRFLSRGFASLAQGLAAGDVSQLAEMHMMTSGLKVLVSTTAIQDIEGARRAMGGHGYSGFSGVGRLYADYLPAATYEGENYVLDGQVLRAALKSFRGLASTSSPKFSPTSAYLRLLLEKNPAPPQLTAASWNDHTVPILILEWRAALLVNEAAQTAKEPDSTLTQRVSRAVTEAFVAGQVGGMIAALPTKPGLSPKEVDVLRKVYLLYLLTVVEASLVDTLSYGLFRASPAGSADGGSRDPTRQLRLAIAALCSTTLLPEIIGLTDAFGFSDWELDSALGVYDGRAYEAMWARAQTEPLNKTEVTDAFEASIKPILLRGRELAAATKSKSKL